MWKALLIALVTLLPANVSAATNLLLKIDGVPGESVIDKHKDEIDVVSFAWGVGPNDARKPVTCATELTVTKLFDAASPALALAALLKQRFTEARLLVQKKTGDIPSDLVTITMQNVGVVRYQTGGAETDNTLVESVGLGFTELTVSYQQQGPNGDAVGPPRTFTYQSTKPCLKN